MSSSRLSLTAFAAICLLWTLPAAAERDGAVSFVERFRILDLDRWYVSDGWSNGEWTANDWRRSQVSLDRRGLNITLQRVRGRDKPFSSGEVQSRARFHYGYFEARLQAPRSSGAVTGFFTFVRDGDARSWDEIDIELLGRDTRSIQFTYFTNGVSTAHVVRLPFDAADEMHTYGFYWDAEQIEWYVDGVLLHETSDGAAVPQRPQRLFVSLWNSRTLAHWVGPIYPWDHYSVLSVECIAYSQMRPPPGTSLCG